jgi:hypothetical protein
MNLVGVSQWSIDPISDIEKICSLQHIENIDKFVLYGQTEWSPFIGPCFKPLLKLAESYNKKLTAISGAYKIFNTPFTNKVDYEYSPTFFLVYTFTNLYQNNQYINDYISNMNQNEFRYNLISYNNQSHPHRCELIDLLYKNGLFEKNLISWHHSNFTNLYNKAKNSPYNSPYDFKYWTPKKMLLDDNYEHTKNQSYLSSSYFQSFAQLVSEATENAIFLTEKTAYPLFLKKPFLVATAPGFHSFLQSLGFKLYDEIFNYDFDAIIDRTERYERLLENFSKLKNLNLTELYEIVKNKLEYNRLRAVEIATNLNFLSETLIETINLQTLHKKTIDPLSYSVINQILPAAINTYTLMQGKNKY